MDKNGDSGFEEIPLGLAMALAQNQKAMQYFASLSKGQRQAVTDGAKNVKTKAEMQALVSGLCASDIKM